MKSIYIPQSLLDELPFLEIEKNEKRRKIAPACQIVLFRLLTYSGPKYQVVWPGMSTICRETGIKSETTVRKLIRELEAVGVVHVKKTYTKTARGDLIMRNNYYFTFAPWIAKDRAAGLAGDADGIQAMVEEHAKRAAKAAAHIENKKVNQRIDRVEFKQKTIEAFIEQLPEALRPWLNHMKPHTMHGKTYYFKENANEQLNKAFTEEQFAKHGLQIKILAS